MRVNVELLNRYRKNKNKINIQSSMVNTRHYNHNNEVALVSMMMVLGLSLFSTIVSDKLDVILVALWYLDLIIFMFIIATERVKSKSFSLYTIITYSSIYLLSLQAPLIISYIIKIYYLLNRGSSQQS